MAPPDLPYYHAMKHRYLRAIASNRNAPEPIHAKILRLQSITDYLVAFETMAAKVRILLHFGHQRDLVELAILSPFESVEELAQGLAVLFPGSKRLLAQEEYYFDNNLDVQTQEGLPKVRAIRLSNSINSGV